MEWKGTMIVFQKSRDSPGVARSHPSGRWFAEHSTKALVVLASPAYSMIRPWIILFQDGKVFVEVGAPPVMSSQSAIPPNKVLLRNVPLT